MTAVELLNEAERLRRECRFGDAINVFREAAAAVIDQEQHRAIITKTRGILMQCFNIFTVLLNFIFTTL